jgi:AmiR/NasT family two-component response regulator
MRGSRGERSSGEPVGFHLDEGSRAGARHVSGPESLRGLRALVLHPRDGDGDIIIRNLQRLSCQVRNLWHPRLQVVDHFDAVFFSVNEDAYRHVAAYMDRSEVAFIAIVESDLSAVDQLLTECSPHAALCKPVRPADVLTSLLLARSLLRYENRLLTKVRKLEETLKSVRTVEKAKAILMATRGLNEKEAYELLRKSAMNRRVPIGQVASAVVQANDILSI